MVQLRWKLVFWLRYVLLFASLTNGLTVTFWRCLTLPENSEDNSKQLLPQLHRYR